MKTFNCDKFVVKIQQQDDTYFITYSGDVPKDLIKKINFLNVRKPDISMAETMLMNELKQRLLYTR